MNIKRSVAGVSLVVAATFPVLSISSGSSAAPDAKVGPDERRCFTVEGEPGDAAVVNLTPVQAGAAGNGKLVSSDVESRSESSNVNFAPGTADPNVAIAPIGADGQVCYVNSEHTSVHLVADHLGTIDADVYTSADPSGEVVRIDDTRDDGPPVGPTAGTCGGIYWNRYPGADQASAAFVNVTPVRADARGWARLLATFDKPPTPISNVNYAPGTVDPNVGIAKFLSFDGVPGAGYVCVRNSGEASVHIVLDLMGWVDSSVFVDATELGTPLRSVDTRASTQVAPNGRLCFDVTGEPGDAAIVNLTPVNPTAAGDGQLVSSDVAVAPEASNVNYRPWDTDPNVAIAPIGRNGQVCFVNSRYASVDLVADHLGTIRAEAYTPAGPGGAPVRVIDTRG